MTDWCKQVFPCQFPFFPQPLTSSVHAQDGMAVAHAPLRGEVRKLNNKMGTREMSPGRVPRIVLAEKNLGKQPIEGRISRRVHEIGALVRLDGQGQPLAVAGPDVEIGLAAGGEAALLEGKLREGTVVGVEEPALAEELLCGHARQVAGDAIVDGEGETLVGVQAPECEGVEGEALHGEVQIGCLVCVEARVNDVSDGFLPLSVVQLGVVG